MNENQTSLCLKALQVVSRLTDTWTTAASKTTRDWLKTERFINKDTAIQIQPVMMHYRYWGLKRPEVTESQHTFMQPTFHWITDIFHLYEFVYLHHVRLGLFQRNNLSTVTSIHERTLIIYEKYVKHGNEVKGPYEETVQKYLVYNNSNNKWHIWNTYVLWGNTILPSFRHRNKDTGPNIKMFM